MKNIYITQFNTPWSRNLMPLSAGLLKAYALTDPEIKEQCRFFIETEREKPQKIIERYDSPDLLAYSVYFWNLRQTLETIREAKKKFPHALVVVGGPSAPLHEKDVKEFFKQNPGVDITIAGEGEVVFLDLLRAFVKGAPINAISGISYRDARGEAVFQEKRKYIQDVSKIPSPFLDGTFSSLLENNKNTFSGVVWETNRGCPFSCTFCFWGGPDSKISQFPMDRVLQELKWISDNKISYIFGADANFGILKRDLDIAKELSRLNRETGYPKFFVINWTKNATEKIFDIVDAFSQSSLKFMMTTSVQSHNPDTLKAIRRENIKLDSFNKILDEATKRQFHTYSELILGLPLETYETFKRGIGKVLVPNIRYHFNVYTCVLIPGTQMAEPDYVKKYGLITRECKMDVGRTVLNTDAILESQRVVVGTETMPIEDWRKSHTFAYMCKSLFGFRLLYFITNWLHEQHGVVPIEWFEFIIRRAQDPKVMSQYPIVNKGLGILKRIQDSLLTDGFEVTKIAGVESALFPEVALLLTFLEDKSAFYQEIDRLIQELAIEKQFSLVTKQYLEIKEEQMFRVPHWSEPKADGSYFKSKEEFLSTHLYGGMIFVLKEERVIPTKVAASAMYKSDLPSRTQNEAIPSQL